VSFYISILLTAVAPAMPSVKDNSELDSALSDDSVFQQYEVVKAESLSTISSNARISSLAILITTIIKTFQHQLSLYHAIFVFHLMFFLTVVHVGSSSSDQRANGSTPALRNLRATWRTAWVIRLG
jgi:hypothetical protein